MSEDSSDKKKESSVEGTVKAVTGLVKEVPIYQDAVQPIAKETGKALQTIGEVVNKALLPIKGLIWGIEKIEEFVETKVSDKLKNIPPENIQTPDPSVAGPALESLRYTGHKESLSELYANLLASSMNSETAKNAHPGFVEIIRNMSSDEAKILELILENEVYPVVDIIKVFPEDGGEIAIHELVSTIGNDSKCEHGDLVSTYLVNLERLGLIEIPRTGHIVKKGIYDIIINDQPVKDVLDKINKLGDGVTGRIEKHYVRITQLGRQFGMACVNSKT